MTLLKSNQKQPSGKIESKIVVMILAAMLLVAGVFLAVSLTRSNMLAKLTEETTERQLSSMTGTTNAVINTVIKENMDRITDMEAQAVDGMFEDVSVRVRMVMPGNCWKNRTASRACPGPGRTSPKTESCL